MSSTYKSVGVDIEAGNALVRRIGPAARATERPGMLGGLGGFGGLFDLKAAGYRDPLLVAATDGIGTKLRIAIDLGRHSTIGQDLVAMCVNDLVVQGAEPLFFLDYFATGRLAPDVAAEVIEGIARACSEAGCGLIGGETAEMPGMYVDGDYDVAGFAVGAVERAGLLTGADVAAGDLVLGLASSGVHSNGFSLVRRVAADAGLDWAAAAPFDPAISLGDALLTPTRIYVKACLAAIGAGGAGGVRGLAHITGGGLLENIPRVLPAGLGVHLTPGSWSPLPVFGWLAGTGVAPEEMARTFNCGIGMAVIVAAGREAAITAAFEAAGETVFTIGTVVADDDQQVTPVGGWPPGWPGTGA